MKKFGILFIALVGFAVSSFGQSVTATATATGKIVAPLTITKVNDMNFGTVAVSSSTAGTVILAPAGTRSVTGGAQVVVTGGGGTAASFNITGEGTSTYAITLPADGTVTVISGANSMPVNTFTSSPATTGTLSSGAQTVTVGATLEVAAGQATGTYTSAAFNVTVAYN
jgi:hypothetical protein